eukprot:TRINITY_DN10230_c0_g1_i1.p1 TRINITY_DN10230_c0_g1~~TRINITY_DN10230_c0_g1_i1.p1  ORF type:complete len:239 (-),score=47.58 TRINITY_DN10230_c0_g1_i1:4-720(-)
MLDSVLYARDKYLKPNGILFPSRCSISAAPVNMEEFFEEKFGFWNNVYGFDFSLVSPMVKQTELQQPKVVIVKPEQLLAKPVTLFEFDCSKIQIQDLHSLNRQFSFEISKQNNSKKDKFLLQGFCVWFDVVFAGDTTVVLSTAPGTPDTHWKQVVVLLPKDCEVKEGEKVEGKIWFQKDPDNERLYNIAVGLGSGDETSETDDIQMDFDLAKKENGHPADCECTTCNFFDACMDQVTD